jgi:glutamine---fructose-6-phosphate transaminase (isomerizing)
MPGENLSQLERELRQQGEVLAARADAGWEDAALAAAVLRRGDVDHLVIAARGSSDNAARYAQYLLGTEARLLVGLAAPWLYSGGSPPLLSRAAALGISQSGRSPDVVGVLEVARAQGRPTIAITNDPQSPLGAAAEVIVPLLAGAEQSVAATKTYLASLHAIAQIAACVSEQRDRGGWFCRLPEIVSAVVEEQLETRRRFEPLAPARLLTVIGRGLQLPSAYETALKVRELSGIPAEPFSLPDLIHGPIAAVGADAGVWLISTRGREQPERETLEELRRRAMVTVAVSDDPQLTSAADIGVQLPAELPQWLAPLIAVIPAQAAALALGELRGVEIDQPHGLRKVTLTR